MTQITACFSTRPTSRTRAGLDYVLERVQRLGRQLRVVVLAPKRRARALQVVVVARLLLAEARVIDGPFFGGGWADICVEALVVFVDGDVAWDGGGREVCGDVVAITTSRLGFGTYCGIVAGLV